MNTITKQLHSVLEQDMDRKEFLKFSGALLLGAIGVNKLVGALGKLDKTKHKMPQVTNSYGNSPYGR